MLAHRDLILRRVYDIRDFVGFFELLKLSNSEVSFYDLFLTF